MMDGEFHVFYDEKSGNQHRQACEQFDLHDRRAMEEFVRHARRRWWNVYVVRVSSGDGWRTTSREAISVD